MKKYHIHFINHEGEIVHPEETEGISWRMKALPDGREYSQERSSDDIYKAQRDALIEWAMKMKW